jgi:hypothetical protein
MLGGRASKSRLRGQFDKVFMPVNRAGSRQFQEDVVTRIYLFGETD